MKEHELVPYSAAPLRAERLLIVAPHPDDEVIGCGGIIAQHVALGRPLRVVIASDGAAGGATAEERLRESAAGLAILGAGEPVSLGLPDRRVPLREVREAVERHIAEFDPDAIAAPSPLEIHPDHVTVARAVFEAVHEERAAGAPKRRVIFYEVTQPIRPNHLVDITAECEAKFAALAAHRSQAGRSDLVSLTRALNHYRSATLIQCEFAEAFWIAGSDAVRGMTWEQFRLRMAGGSIEVIREEIPITVLIRTSNRRELLREAVRSALANGCGAWVVVVNDGGESPHDALPDDVRVTLVDLPDRVGRAEAMNVAARTAETPFLAFLDDDDLYYADHLETLANGARSFGAAGCYSDALYTELEVGPSGVAERTCQSRVFSHDFDREMLLFDNYIPLPTLLLRRDDFLRLGGFDPALETFEDWDFLLRLTATGALVHIPKTTCEVRNFGRKTNHLDARTLADARAQIWARHREEIRAAIERRHADRELLLFEVMGERIRAERAAGDYRERLSATQARLEDVQRQCRDRDRMLRSHVDEVKRLNGILDQIYRSRTWRFHQVSESVRRLFA